MKHLCSNVVRCTARYVALGLAAAALSACAVADSDPQVETDAGWLQGTRDGNVQIFKGVPFAAAPIGELRWRAPQQVESWEGVRSAAAYAPMCAQRETGSLWFELTEVSEDCLYLNIWAPEIAADEQPLPVMISVHGGGLLQGTGNIVRQNGIALARQGVIYISLNYRLSAFGFMTHPALTALHPDEPQGNYGLQDVAAALEWVQSNIAAFGGNPEKVTLFGTSAGADIINALMVMPRTAGLFQRAISQSSSVGIGPVGYQDRRVGFMPATDRLGQAFVKRAGLAEAADIAAALYALSTQDILATLVKADRFPLVIDGTVLPDQLNTLFAAGKAHAVPYLTGTNSFEASLAYDIGVTALAPANFAKQLKAADKNRLYPQLEGARRDEAVFSDIAFTANSRYLATQMQRMGVPVYRYYFNYVADARRDIDPGAMHGSDVAYVVGRLDADIDLVSVSTADQRISELMMAYWVQFAHTGNPNREGLPAWPAFDPAAGNLLEIAATPVVREQFLAERMAFHIDRGQASFAKMVGVGP